MTEYERLLLVWAMALREQDRACLAYHATLHKHPELALGWEWYHSSSYADRDVVRADWLAMQNAHAEVAAFHAVYDTAWKARTDAEAAVAAYEKGAPGLASTAPVVEPVAVAS